MALQATAQERQIEQLRSDDPVVREDASRGLRELRRDAIPLLETAAKSTDQELSHRALELLRIINSDIAREEIETLRNKLEKATTLRIRFEGEWVTSDNNKELRKDFAGRWLLGQGGKGCCSCSWRNGGGPLIGTFVFWSDGKSMLAGRDQDIDKPLPTTPGFRLELTAGLLNLGLGYSSFKVAQDSLRSDSPHTILPELSRVSHFKVVDDQKNGMRELVFRVLESDQSPLFESHLYCKLESGIPLKRTVTLFDKKTGVPRSTLSETYTEWAYDKDIDPEEFILPGGKK